MEPQKPGNSARSGPEVVDGQRVAELPKIEWRNESVAGQCRIR